MTKGQRNTFEMLLRVRDFGKALLALFPESSAGANAFAIVADAAARIESQIMARTVAALAGQKARQLARQEVGKAILEIAVTARGLDPAARGGAEVLRLPKQRNMIALLTTARTFVAEAKPVEKDLVALGLKPTFLTDLERAASRFDEALGARREGRREVALANQAVARALADARKATRTLDIIVPNVLRDQPDLLAGWRRDRRVVSGDRFRTAAAPADTTRNDTPEVEPAPAPAVPLAS